MTVEPAREHARRVADTLAKLSATGADVWVATASAERADDAAAADPAEAAAGARAHLVPLSLAWLDGCVVIAVEQASLTARNLAASGAARLGLGPTRDVVMIDARVDRMLPLDGVPADVAERYAVQTGWDPRTTGPGYLLIFLRPQRIQAWREENELAGRTLMRAGVWLGSDGS
jgi:hypothetical protein